LSSAGRGFRGWSPESLASSGRPGGERTGEATRRLPSAKENPETESTPPEDLFLRSDELVRVEEEARKAGFDAGYAEGLERARADMEPLRQAWIEWASRISAFEAERLRSLLPVLVDLLGKAFERVLGEEEGRPQRLRSLLERMVGEYASGREAELLVSDSDYQQVVRFDPGFPGELSARGVRMGIAPDLPPRHVELRFADRIVSFDPATAGDSLRRTLSRVNPGPLPEEGGGKEEGETP